MDLVAFDKVLAEGRQQFMSSRSCTEWIGQPISQDEASTFLAAMRANLVRLVDSGMSIELTGFPFTKAPKRYRLYAQWKGRAYWGWQEAFIQIGFAAELVLLHGWPATSVQLETGLDVAVIQDVGAPPFLLAEAKLTTRDLDYVMGVMEAMSTDPTTHLDASPRSNEGNAANKYRALIRYRPRYYVEVAPGHRRAYRLHFDSEHPHPAAITFERLHEMSELHQRRCGGSHE